MPRFNDLNEREYPRFNKAFGPFQRTGSHLMNNNPPTNQTLTTWGFVLALFGAILYFVSKGQFIFAALVVGLIPFLTLAREPGKWWLAAIMLTNSGLLTPGLGTNLTLSLLASVGFIVLALLDRIFHRSKIALGNPQRLAGMLVVLLVCLASYRGWGLKILGSSSWGGMQYVQLLIGLLFFFYSQQVKVEEKWLKRALLLYFGLSLLPAIITLSTQYVPALGVLEAIVKIQDLAQSDLSQGTSLHRIGSLHFAAASLGYLAILLYDRNLKLSWKIIGMGVLSFIFAGMSGHRVAVARLVLMGFIYTVIRWRKIPQAQRVKGIVAGICLLGSLYVFAQFLPLGFQRTLSILPGISISAVASEDAQGTSDWRIEMWRKMLPMIPKYLLIGRGAGFDLKEAYGAYISASDRTNQHDFFISTHSYHNGPLWAMIDLGGTGSVLLFSFMIAALVRYGRRLSWNYSPFMGSAYVVFYAILMMSFFFFLSVFGYHGDVVQMALISSILEVISGRAKAGSIIPSKSPEDKRVAGRLSRGRLPVRNMGKSVDTRGV